MNGGTHPKKAQLRVACSIQIAFALAMLIQFPHVARAAGRPLFRPGDMTNGLVGYWKLDEASGTRLDSSGRTNHLADNNGVGSVADDYWGTGERSADLESGSSQFLSITHAAQNGLSITGSHSISAWIKLESATTGLIAGKNTGAGIGYGLSVSSSGALSLRVQANSYSTPSGIISIGKWHHVLSVFDDPADTVSLYVDGNLAAAFSSTNSLSGGSFDFRIGRLGDGSELFDGLLKDAAVWNRVLTPLEAKSLGFGVNLSASAFRPANVSVAPTAWWKLNEVSSGGSAVTRMDSAGSHHLTDGSAVGSSGGYLEGIGAGFDRGSSEHFTHPHTADFDFGSGDFTMATWAKLKAPGNVSYIFAAKFTYAASDAGWLWYLGNETGFFRLYHAGTGFVIVNLPSPLRTNTWYHFAVQRNGAVIRFYVDGKQIGSDQPANSTYDAAATPLYIGSEPDTSQSWDGTMQDLAIWKGYALTTNELTSLATGLPVQSAGVVSYWKLDETNGLRTDALSQNHLSSSGVGFASGVVGMAADFEKASNQFLSITHALQSGLSFSNQTHSIVAWIKPESVNSDQVIAGKWASLTGYKFGLNSADNLDLVHDGLHANDGSTVGTGTWQHVAASWIANANIALLWLNGLKTLDQSFSTAPSATTSDFRLGATANPDRYFDGLMDEVVVARRWFREEEIKALYNRGLNGQEAFEMTPPPAITALSATSGAIGSSITITGSGFSTNASDNIVFFGAVRATNVTAASITNLAVLVPPAATYAPVSVTVNGLTAFSPAPFGVTFASSRVFEANSFATNVDVVINAPEEAAVGDFNGDGRPDFVVANDSVSKLVVFGNSSVGSNLTFTLITNLNSGSYPAGVRVGDFDGDGKLDAVAVNFVSDSVSIFHNITTNSGIQFEGPLTKSVNSGPIGCELSDLDGDGKVDLVVANYGGGLGNSISVFRNISVSGSIAFASKQDFQTGPSSRWVAAGDLDGDGKPDLAILSFVSSPSLALLRNTSSPGSISFASKVDHDIGPDGWHLVLADFDGDGRPDLTVAAPKNDTSGFVVSVIRNVSSPGVFSFASKVDFPAGSAPTGLAAADMDGDGKPDLVVANNSNGLARSVNVLRNTSVSGSLSFATPVDFSNGRTDFVALADLDGDGRIDILASSYNSNRVAVFRNSLAPPAAITTQPQSQSVYAGLNATFTVSITGGGGPLGYQWRKDGTNLIGQTNAALVLPNVSAASQGAYSVVVTSLANTNTSAAATLTVIGTAVTPVNLSGTWTLPNSPYVVNTNVVVTNLTIQPGVSVLMVSNTEFRVTGLLQAAGTSNNLITFSRTDTNVGWQGIVFTNASTNSQFDYVRIEGATNTGVRLQGTPLTMRWCVIANNRGDNGGGLRTDSSLLLEDCVITNCIASINGYARGGGIYFTGGAGTTLTLRRCLVAGNSASGNANGDGGGVAADGGTVVLADCEVRQNQAVGTLSRGGGLWTDGALICSNSTVIFNGADDGNGAFGGGIGVLGPATFFDSRFVGNIARAVGNGHVGGGGIYAYEPVLTGCFISSNTCSAIPNWNRRGAGLHIVGSVIHMTNCLLTANYFSGTTSQRQGSAFNASNAGGEIVNCTVAGNEADAFYEFSGAIRNSIVFGNGGFAIGATPTVSYSIIQGGWTNAGSTNVLDVNPLFTDTTNYFLASNSPAVDAGDPNAAYNDFYFPPSRRTATNDMGRWGGPLAGFGGAGGSLTILINGLEGPAFTFTETNAALLTLQGPFTNSQYFYTLDNSPPGTNSLPWTQALTLSNGAPVTLVRQIRAVASNSNFTQSATSGPVMVTFVARPLNLAQQGRGTVTASPAQPSYATNQQVTLTATPGRYYQFVQWSDGSTNNPRAVTIGTNTNLYTAIFTNSVALETYVLKQWEASFGGVTNDEANVVRPTSDGGYIVGGFSWSGISGNKFSTNYGEHDGWVIKLNPSGRREWDRVFGGEGGDWVVTILPTVDGGYLVGGGSSSSSTNGNKTAPSFGNGDYWLIKLDATGIKQWDRTYGGIGGDEIQAIATTPDGGYVLAGASTSEPGTGGGNRTAIRKATGVNERDLWIVKVDGQGAMQWDVSFGTTNGQVYPGDAAVVLAADGGYLVGANVDGSGGDRSSSSAVGDFDQWLLKLRPDGSLEWERTYATSGADRITSHGIKLLADGSSIHVGEWAPPGGSLGRITRVDVSGATLDSATFGTGNRTVFTSLDLSSDGGIFIGGIASGGNVDRTAPAFGADDFWVVKTDPALNKKWDVAFGGSGIERVTHLHSTADGGFVLAGFSDSEPGSSIYPEPGNKTSPHFGSNDVWVVKVAETEVPTGTPITLVNGLYSPTNFHLITETNIVSVTVTSSLPSANIRYTLDGTVPTTNSPLYTGAFNLTNTALVSRAFPITAVAWNSNLTASATSDVVTVTFVPRVLNLAQQGRGSVAASPVQSGYALGQTVTLTPTADRYYQFLRWSDGNTNNPRAITIAASNNLFTAIFTNTVPLTNLVLKQWERVFGGTNDDAVLAAVPTPDGGFVFGGNSSSPSGPGKTATNNIGSEDGWIVKCDAFGNRQWERSFGGTDSDAVNTIVVLQDQGYLLVGSSLSGISGNKTNANFGSSDFWIIRLDAQGNRLWDKVYGGSGDDQASCGIQTADGGFLIGGSSTSGIGGNKTSSNLGGMDGWVLKLDASGIKQWEKTYGSNSSDAASYLCETSEGYFIGGSVSTAAYNAWAARVDRAGNLLGQYFYQGNVIVNDGLALPDGGFYLVGYTYPSTDDWLVRVDAVGNTVSGQVFGGSGNDWSHTIAPLREGGYLIGGESLSGVSGDHTYPNFGQEDYWIL